MEDTPLSLSETQPNERKLSELSAYLKYSCDSQSKLPQCHATKRA